MRMLAILMVLLGSAPAPASANDDLNLFFQNTPSGNDPQHGAVMCVWMITVSIKVLGENCYGGRDAAYLEAIDWSIREMEAFIMRNSRITADQLAQGRAHFVRLAQKEISADREQQCVSRQHSIYPAPDKIPTRQEIEASTRQLLSVDRSPVWNPCL